jgi:hypothetical protein
MITELLDLNKLNILKDLFYKEKDGKVSELKVLPFVFYGFLI